MKSLIYLWLKIIKPGLNFKSFNDHKRRIFHLPNGSSKQYTKKFMDKGVLTHLPSIKIHTKNKY